MTSFSTQFATAQLRLPSQNITACIQIIPFLHKRVKDSQGDIKGAIAYLYKNFQCIVCLCVCEHTGKHKVVLVARLKADDYHVILCSRLC